MRRTLLGLILLFILLTTYNPKLDYILNSNFYIKKIVIENNSIVKKDKLKKKLVSLYRVNLFFLNSKNVEKILKSESFIEGFSIKKIYPSTLKIKIIEKKPIAIIQNKRKKSYISDKGSLANFAEVKRYNQLPTVFGDGKSFFFLYKDLQNIKFPIEIIKSFYLFESGRWDLVTHDEKKIKLPIKQYLLSLKNFMKSQKDSSFNNYKIFDYRIKDQIILN
jgi:cell division protein FtsQ